MITIFHNFAKIEINTFLKSYLSQKFSTPWAKPYK
jgi:hypothetical protein